MRIRPVSGIAAVSLLLGAAAQEAVAPQNRKATFVEAVTHGEGLMPWQEPGPSPQENAFRASIEKRKEELLAARVPVPHPVMIDPGALDTVRERIASTTWGAAWFGDIKSTADNLIGQPPGYVENMIPELTPTNTYGFTCPHCVGVKSQEGVGSSLYRWSPDAPDEIVCRACGQRYPDPAYPETASLVAPRMGQTFTFYLNDAERKNPDDRSGELAYHWVGHPIHVSFSGDIRESKIEYMRKGLNALALAYWITGDSRYGKLGITILTRFAHCYRNWLYHDYWDAFADCDPLYAAWHDTELPLEWKRHLCAGVYGKDTLEKARMEQSYWGAGRIHPSTDSISGLVDALLAYDLLYDAHDAEGQSLWTPETRASVERDFFLEYVMGAEPYVGGARMADSRNNKSPRIYNAFAAIGKCLGLPDYADTALRGYERVRDESFLYDGFSRESPAYTNMYLSQLIAIPETLNGFQWPEGYAGRRGTVDYYHSDPRLELMFRAVVDQLHPTGRYLPLSDTNVRTAPSRYIIEVGTKRYPQYYAGMLHALYGDSQPTDYGLFNLSESTLAKAKAFSPPEVLFPAWMEAILRHGSAVLSLSFSPPGGHRHHDNLALFYGDTDATYLGDHGYVGDMPVNSWIKSTQSHNLVVVDDQDQSHDDRVPSLLLAATTPLASVVEAGSTAYPQCSKYRRLVILLKGPDDRAIAVDIFRVIGGGKHAYRVFSEVASSDAAEGALQFTGLDMPPELPLPQIGSSLAKEDIFGLRDVRTATPESTPWQAVWREPGHAYRLWMLSDVSRVEASNGPGQQTRNDAGRRVRYVDAVREGQNLASTFVAVHEPLNGDETPRVNAVERLEPPVEPGSDAVAITIETTWGSYTVLNTFAQACAVNGMTFSGDLGIAFKDKDGTSRLWSLGASEFTTQGKGFTGATGHWTGQVSDVVDSAFTPSTPRPEGFPEVIPGAYVRINDGTYWTGFPLTAMDTDRVSVGRFPIPDTATSFDMPALRIVERPDS